VREPEGNGVAERFIRTLKENLLRVRTFDTIEELRTALVEFATGVRLSGVPNDGTQTGFCSSGICDRESAPPATPTALGALLSLGVCRDANARR
jgi:hypothetical protein